MVKSRACFFLAFLFAACLLVAKEYLPPKAPGTAMAFDTSCIQGVIWYLHPVDSTRTPLTNATVTAWDVKSSKGISETKTDSRGQYCITVPAGDYKIQLKVWALQRLDRKGYVCKKVSDDINPGLTPRKCGEDCIRLDMEAECSEYKPPMGRGT